MFQKLIVFAIILFTVVIQLSIFPHFFGSGIAPDLVLMLVIIWTMQDGFEKTLARAITAGLVLDLMSFEPAGFSAISLVVISYLTGALARRFLVTPRPWKLLFVIVIIAIGTLAHQVIMNILSISGSHLNLGKIEWIGLKLFDWRIFPKIIYNAIMFFMIYWPMRKMENFLSMYSKGFVSQTKIFR